VQIRELSVPGAFEVTPRQFPDDRGTFWEWYRFDALAEAVGHPLDLKQGNGSVSRKGVVRGIHFADVPPSQAKYVTVTHGAVLDFVIDIRVGSPTFGQWDSVLLNTVDRRAVYVGEGLGHCFVTLEDDSVVSYLVSEVFSPTHEHGITPLDETIGLTMPLPLDQLLLSPKDVEAPTLREAQAAGLLPSWDAARAFTGGLDSDWRSGSRQSGSGRPGLSQPEAGR
jgi:dTDP-4-dehydrorhamnose 3,5-epimerase